MSKMRRIGSFYQLLFATLEAGRPFAIANGTPPDRVAALRKAFAELSQDDEFLRELRQRGGSIEYMPGEEIEHLISAIYATPRDVIDRGARSSGSVDDGRVGTAARKIARPNMSSRFRLES